MSGSSSDDKKKAIQAVTAGLLDQKTAEQLQATGESSRQRRLQAQAEKKKRDEDAKNKKCMPLLNRPLGHHHPLMHRLRESMCMS